jgi:hypothetical protein
VTEPREIEPLWHVRFYDGAIDGVVLFRGELCWFRWNENLPPPLVSEDVQPMRVYEIFAMTDAEVRGAVTEHLRFERYVGLGSCYHVTANGARPKDMNWYSRYGTVPEDNPFYKGRPLGTIGAVVSVEGKVPLGQFTGVEFRPRE